MVYHQELDKQANQPENCRNLVLRHSTKHHKNEFSEQFSAYRLHREARTRTHSQESQTSKNAHIKDHVNKATISSKAPDIMINELGAKARTCISDRPAKSSWSISINKPNRRNEPVNPLLYPHPETCYIPILKPGNSYRPWKLVWAHLFTLASKNKVARVLHCNWYNTKSSMCMASMPTWYQNHGRH